MSDLWLAMRGPEPPQALSRIPEHLRKNPKGTAECARQGWEWMTQLAHCAGRCDAPQHATCWGWDIVRISYLDDAQFARAVRAVPALAEIYIADERERHVKVVEKLRRLGLDGPEDFGPSTGGPITLDPTPNDTATGHYHHKVIQDRGGGLEGATPDQARAYLLSHGWQGSHRGNRGNCFIYMDQQAIDHLSGAPLPGEEDGPVTPRQRDRAAVMHWVKVVDMYEDVADMQQRRLRLWDLFDVFLSADAGLQRFPTWRPEQEGDDDVDADTAAQWPFVKNEHAGKEPKDVRGD